jgi:photosystem II stability/assembly factor-like uncharacterized protein
VAAEAQTAFISYSRDDSEFALRLAEDLKAAGAAVWLDQLDIAPGQRWARAIQDALNDCPRMLIILSPASATSTNVDDEVSFALEEHKTVIPVLYRECKIPFRLRPFQYVDFRSDYAAGLEILTKAVANQKPAILIREQVAEPIVSPPEIVFPPEVAPVVPRTWKSQVSGTELGLRSVAFANHRSGCAVGDYGTILRTKDGQTWEQQLSGTPASLYSIIFASEQFGWTVGEAGIILHTEDGGASWMPQASNTHTPLLSVYFVNERSGWAVGEVGVILHTADGGASWVPQPSGTDKHLLSVCFVNEQSGLTVGLGGIILRTDDGGGKWTPQTSNSQSFKKSLYSVAMLTPQLGWAVGTTDILHCDDGASWTVQGLDPKSPMQAYGIFLGRELRSVYFRTPKVGWAVGENIHHTEDGGKTWKMQQSIENILLRCVAFPTPESGWVVGTKGTILHWG